MTYCCIFKIDRLYDWKKSPDTDVAVTLKKQKKNTKDEFEERAKAIIVEFAKQVGWNIQTSLLKSASKEACGGLVCFGWVGGFGFILVLPLSLKQLGISRKLLHLFWRIGVNLL